MRNVSLGLPGSCREEGSLSTPQASVHPTPGAKPATEAAAQRAPVTSPWPQQVLGEVTSKGRAIAQQLWAHGASSARQGPSKGVRGPSVPQQFTFLWPLRLCRGPAGGRDPPDAPVEAG